MTESPEREFARYLATLDDEGFRSAMKRARFLATQDMPEGAFDPPIRTAGEYLDTPIIIPASLVYPTIVIRGEITTTLGRAGKGKAQPLSAGVLTPEGWTTMGDISVGDAVVDPDGGEATVLGVYPQGERQVYRVTFSDGSVVRADGDHLWQVSRRSDYDDSRVKTTLALRNDLGSGKRWRTPAPVPFDHVNELDRPVDPYALGLLLGDGGLTTGQIRFSSADLELVESLCHLTGASARHIDRYDYSIRSGRLAEQLRSLKVMWCGAHTKSVPKAYKWATAASRLELLRGLLDTDGHADVCGGAEFCSASDALANDVVELVRSLGGWASKRRTSAGTAWKVHVAFESIVPFTLKRKVDAYVTPTQRPPRHTIVRIEPDAIEPVQCISVSSSGDLYVTDDWKVTHNTTFNLNRICKWSAGLPLFDDWEDSGGRPYLAPESPLKTLVIENEGSAGMFQHKLGIMLNREAYLTPEHRSLARDNVLIWGDGGFSDFKLDDEGKVNLLRAGCEKWQPDIVFLEPFRSLWRGEENSSTDMTEVINTLQVVAKEYNCGIILSHHERKSGAGEDGELMSAARGSGVLEGAVAVMENFQAVVGGAYREITWSKARYLQPPPTTRMEYQPADEWYTHVPASSLEERLLLLLEDNEEALTVRQLADMTDEKEDRLRNTLNAMYEQARVQRRAAIPGETGYRWKSVKAGPDDDQLPI